MNKNFIAGVVVGFLLCYFFKVEKVTSTITFPAADPNDNAWPELPSGATV